jgi:hypothetical protein
MPPLHRVWGNPMFSRLARKWFRASITDVYCGFRGFSRDFWLRLGQSAGGMEFATEMIIRASLRRTRIAEVPITLHPDGRVAHAPHLRTFRDGWRTLRLYLMYSPRRLFLMPGAVAVALGLLGYALALPGFSIMGATLDAHTLLFASLAILCGSQAITFAVLTKALAIADGLPTRDRRWILFFRILSPKRVAALTAAALGGGLILLVLAVLQWGAADFGRLDYSETMRLVIPGATLTALAVQTILLSLLVSILRMRRL